MFLGDIWATNLNKKVLIISNETLNNSSAKNVICLELDNYINLPTQIKAGEYSISVDKISSIEKTSLVTKIDTILDAEIEKIKDLLNFIIF